jgi:hypothetical protein
MSLTVLTPASVTSLCSVTDVADELGCDTTDTAVMAILARMVKQASDAIASYCDRVFLKQEYRETLPGYGGPTLVLAVWPVVSVSQVLADGTAVTDYTLQDPESGLLYRETGWGWSALQQGRLAPKPVPYSEEFIYQVDYIAGYDGPDELLPNLPGDVERAAIETAKNWFQNRARNKSITEVTQGLSLAVSYTDSDLPPIALRLLSRYRSTV